MVTPPRREEANPTPGPNPLEVIKTGLELMFDIDEEERAAALEALSQVQALVGAAKAHGCIEHFIAATWPPATATNDGSDLREALQPFLEETERGASHG